MSGARGPHPSDTLVCLAGCETGVPLPWVTCQDELQGHDSTCRIGAREGRMTWSVGCHRSVQHAARQPPPRPRTAEKSKSPLPPRTGARESTRRGRRRQRSPGTSQQRFGKSLSPGRLRLCCFPGAKGFRGWDGVSGRPDSAPELTASLSSKQDKGRGRKEGGLGTAGKEEAADAPAWDSGGVSWAPEGPGTERPGQALRTGRPVPRSRPS